MDNYDIDIWDRETKSQEYGSPASTFKNIRATNAEMALQKVMRENNMQVVFLAEVRWNNGRNRQQFKNYSLE